MNLIRIENRLDSGPGPSSTYFASSVILAAMVPNDFGKLESFDQNSSTAVDHNLGINAAVTIRITHETHLSLDGLSPASYPSFSPTASEPWTTYTPTLDESSPSKFGIQSNHQSLSAYDQSVHKEGAWGEFTALAPDLTELMQDS